MSWPPDKLGDLPAHDVADYAAYCRSMEKSLDEKLFFLDKLPPEVTALADFGCADGMLLRAAQKHNPSIEHLIGYDHDTGMLSIARDFGGSELTDSYGMFAARLNRHHKVGRKSCLVLSSVIHEVISQGVPWQTLWKAISDLGCTYVAIRDMAVSDDTIDKPAPRIGPPLRDWHAHYSIQSMSDYLQAVLKARYPENADREAMENYFPVTVEAMLNMCTVGSGYKLRHFEHAPLQFLVDEWRAKTGETLRDPTHVKMLLKRTH